MTAVLSLPYAFTGTQMNKPSMTLSQMFVCAPAGCVVQWPLQREEWAAEAPEDMGPKAQRRIAMLGVYAYVHCA